MSLDTLGTREIIGMYYERLAQDPGADWIAAISNYFESDQASEEYRWLAQVPMMREWIGGRHAKELASQGVTIENVDFEATLTFREHDLTRDKTGQAQVRIGELVQRTQAHWAKLLATQILSGTTVTGYDGQFYFDTDHSEGDSGTQSNSISVDISALPIPSDQQGSITAPSAEVMEAAIKLGIQEMAGFLDEEGEPLNETASNYLALVPTPFWTPSLAAVTLPNLSQGRSNLLANNGEMTVQTRTTPRLNAWTDKFALFRTDGAVRPMIRQEEVGVEASMLGRESEYFFDNRRMKFGVYSRRNVGFGRWQHACLVTLI